MLTRRTLPQTAPIRDLFEVLNRDVGRLLGPDMATAFGSAEAGFPMDISEHQGHLVIRADLPGFSRQDVNVHVQNGVLTIEARRKEERESKSDGGDQSGERYYRKERFEGSMVRRLELPSRFTDSEPVAELREGVLTLRFPESPSAKPRQIAIQ
jgi:HSP20 family protein